MPNMAYCRFTNTKEDLQDCMDHIDEPVSEAEHKARIQLVKRCAELIFDYAGADNGVEAIEWAETLDVD